MDSNKYDIQILPEAESDIRKTFDYIAKKLLNQTAADNLMLEIYNAVDTVAHFPYSMPILKNKRVTTKEYRRIMINNYALIYKINESAKEILIMAMFYAPSNYIKIFEDS